MLLLGLDDGKILYTTVFENIMRAGNWKCVISGCAVSPSSGMNVSVGSGSILFDDSLVSVSGTILNVGSSLQDRDRVVVIAYDGSDGQLKVLSRNEWLQIGSNYYPLTQRLTSNQVALAIVRIPKGASGITTNDIIDVRSMFNVGADINAFKRILKAINRETNVGAIISALQNESDDVASMVLMNLQDGVLASVLNSSSISDSKAIAWANRLCDKDVLKLVNALAHANLGASRTQTIITNIRWKFLNQNNTYLFYEPIYAVWSKITDTGLRNFIVAVYSGFDYWNSYVSPSIGRIASIVAYGAPDVTYTSNTTVNFVIANNLTVNSGVTLTLNDGAVIIANNIYNNGTIKGNSGFYIFSGGTISGGVFESGYNPIGQMIRFGSNDRSGNGGNGGSIGTPCCGSTFSGGAGGNPGGGGGGAGQNPDGCYNGAASGTVSFTTWSLYELKRRLMLMAFYRLGWSGVSYQFPSIGGVSGGGGGGASGGELIVVGYSVSGTFNAYGLNGANGGEWYDWGKLYRSAPSGGGGGGLIYIFRVSGSPTVNVSGGQAGSLGSLPQNCLAAAATNGAAGSAFIYDWWW